MLPIVILSLFAFVVATTTAVLSWWDGYSVLESSALFAIVLAPVVVGTAMIAVTG